MLVAFSTGVLLWLVYGVAVRSWPLMISNAVTFGLAALLVLQKVRLARRRVPAAEQPVEAPSALEADPSRT